MKTQIFLHAAVRLAAAAALAATASCRTPHDAVLDEGRVPVAVGYGKAAGPSAAFIPKAIVYKTNGDYNDNVPVTLDAARTALLAFPAPSDITPESAPLPVADGFLLDRRGVSYNTAFTRWTYAEYAALKRVPSPAEILAAVIPDARVVEVVTLPMTTSEAVADTAAVNACIRAL